MTTNDERHQMIARHVMRQPDTLRDDSIVLWTHLSAELCAIIGQSGFDTLYARSLHVVRGAHPWLAEGSDPCFEQLKTCLDAQTAEAAARASVALLTTFTDTLTQLIGASLTTAILRSAWGQDTADTAAEEI